jgi:hypothetical protein
LADFYQHSAYLSQQRWLMAEHSGNAGSEFDFLLDSLKQTGGTHLEPMPLRKHVERALPAGCFASNWPAGDCGAMLIHSQLRLNESATRQAICRSLGIRSK